MQSFMKIFSTVLKLYIYFHSKNFKRGIIPIKNVGGVTVLFLCTISDGGLYLSKVP